MVHPVSLACRRGGGGSGGVLLVAFCRLELLDDAQPGPVKPAQPRDLSARGAEKGGGIGNAGVVLSGRYARSSRPPSRERGSLREPWKPPWGGGHDDR
jgi:hypothetical protein